MTFSKESKKRVLEKLQYGIDGPISNAYGVKSTQEDYFLMVRVCNMLPQFIELAAHDHPNLGGVR